MKLTPGTFVDPSLDLRDLRALSPEEFRSRPSLESSPDEQLLMIWEPPDKKSSYYIGADVSDGINQDRSVVDVVRSATIDKPFEQVAQYISGTIDPVDLAYVIDTVGRFYADGEGYEAKVAVETNNQGIATQSELERHTGYSNFYVWQWEDAAPGSSRYTRKIGWYTSRRTRPILITRYVKAVKTVDPITNLPDLVVNSSFTVEEMRDFQTEGQIWEAEAGPGATDDCLMAGAIAYFTAQQDFFEQGETIAEARRRRAWQKKRQQELLTRRREVRDFINTDATVDEIESVGYDGEDRPSWLWGRE